MSCRSFTTSFWLGFLSFVSNIVFGHQTSVVLNVMASETSPAGVAWKRPLRSGVCGRDRGPSFNLKSRGHCQGHWLWEDSRPGDTSLDRHLTSQIGRVLASRLCYSVTSSRQSLEAPFHTGSPRPSSLAQPDSTCPLCRGERTPTLCRHPGLMPNVPSL